MKVRFARLAVRIIVVALAGTTGIAFVPSEAEADCKDCWRCCPPFNPCATNCWPHEPGWTPSVYCDKITSKITDCTAIANKCKGTTACPPTGPGPQPDLQAGGLETAVNQPGWFQTSDTSSAIDLQVPFH